GCARGGCRTAGALAGDQSGRSCGTWTVRELDRMDSSVIAAIVEERESLVTKHHYRMGHVSFDKMCKLFPDVMNEVDKNKLKCDVCEFAKLC
uniref:GAG-pre-integrase domain-containing protein n=1 Tax=Aegilops tauschii subsp. strangulata TaxID=200361 RepID=A0A453NUL7_AEGTS